MKLVLALCVLALASAAHWGVLIAGSNGYWNYRHQSDICHAYQIMHKNGVPDSNIIVLQYDDIANSGQNPFKGKVFNKPTPKGTPGVDVYAGCPKDWTGSTITAANFLKVIQGQAVAGHKVLKSTADDNVFIYFSDHGATGLIAMPTGNPLYATELIAALKNMHANKMYKKLVFYLEACESGSMFNKILTSDLNIYATTAANPDESSWGWYCSPDDVVDGRSIGSCLGDEYSIRWMEDSDKATTESLQQQYTNVKTQTVKSHVMQYGDLSYTGMNIFAFQGNKDAALDSHLLLPPAQPSSGYGVDSRDMKLHFLMQQYTRAGSNAVAEELQTEIKARQSADSFFTNLARTVMGVDYNHVMSAKPQGICDEVCCQPAINTIYSKCGALTDYSLKYVRSVVNMCETADNTEAMSNYIVTAISDMC